MAIKAEHRFLEVHVTEYRLITHTIQKADEFRNQLTIDCDERRYKEFRNCLTIDCDERRYDE